MTAEKDTNKYASCISELVEADDAVENLILLAEVNVRIQEVDSELQVHELALNKSPEALTLSRKLAEVLVKNHEHQKAIDHYKSAIANEPVSDTEYLSATVMLLACDLSLLLIHLNRLPSGIKQFEKILDRFELCDKAKVTERAAKKLYIVMSTNHQYVLDD